MTEPTAAGQPAIQHSDFRFFERLRVRWAEIDAQQIVFNGHYLMYLDTAVAGYWRAMALPYHTTMAQLGGDLFVRKATLEYEGSARYDDQLDIGLRCTRIGTSSIVLSAAVFRGTTLLVQGELVYVFADPATQTSKPVPPALRGVFDAFEAGQTVADVRVGPWAALAGDAVPLRHAVFALEQGIAADRMVDADDAAAVHAVAYNRMGLALATGRLLPPAGGVAKLGRMATLAALRGAGLGASVLRALLQAARERGDREVLLHAQAGAMRFYEQQGFVRSGAEFDEVGIAHIEMRRPL